MDIVNFGGFHGFCFLDPPGVLYAACAGAGEMQSAKW